MQTQTKISLIINNKKQIMNKNDIFGTLFDNLTLNKVKFNDVGWKINGQITDIKRNQQLQKLLKDGDYVEHYFKNDRFQTLQFPKAPFIIETPREQTEIQQLQQDKQDSLIKESPINLSIFDTENINTLYLKERDIYLQKKLIQQSKKISKYDSIFIIDNFGQTVIFEKENLSISFRLDEKTVQNNQQLFKQIYQYSNFEEILSLHYTKVAWKDNILAIIFQHLQQPIFIKFQMD